MLIQTIAIEVVIFLALGIACMGLWFFMLAEEFIKTK